MKRTLLPIAIAIAAAAWGDGKSMLMPNVEVVSIELEGDIEQGGDEWVSGRAAFQLNAMTTTSAPTQYGYMSWYPRYGGIGASSRLRWGFGFLGQPGTPHDTDTGVGTTAVTLKMERVEGGIAFYLDGVLLGTEMFAGTEHDPYWTNVQISVVKGSTLAGDDNYARCSTLTGRNASGCANVYPWNSSSELDHFSQYDGSTLSVADGLLWAGGTMVFADWQACGRAQGCVRYGTINTPWRYRNYGGLYEHRVITDDTTQEATGGAAAALWPTGWVWPDGTHGVLYELGGDTVYRRASGPTWYAEATLGADRTRPVMTQLAPSNDVLVAWLDGAACKCKRLRWGGASYATTETEYTIAASMVRPGSIDQLPDGRLVFVGENAAGVGYSLSSDDGATWSEFASLVAGAAYPVACRLGASQDLLMAYADQPWGEATISVCRVAWDGSAYAVASGSTVVALELGGAGQHPMDYLNSVDAIFERASGVPVLLLSLFNRVTGTAGYCSALIMQSDDGGATWTETLLS